VYSNARTRGWCVRRGLVSDMIRAMLTSILLDLCGDRAGHATIHPPSRESLIPCIHIKWGGQPTWTAEEGNDEDTIALLPRPLSSPSFHDRRRRAHDRSRRDAATGEECGDGNSQDGRSDEPSAMSLEIVDAAGSIRHAVTPSAPSNKSCACCQASFPE
jgi:hypothetical protein